jgi:hypothetical protein
VFELGFLPLVLFGGQLGSVVAAAVALSFHWGVNLLQGLDFMPFWCPVFWAFLPDLQGLISGRPTAPDETWYATMAQGFEEEPCRWMLSAAYLLMQVIVSLRFQDLRDMEVLPFTCCPMFSVPRNLFGDEMRGGLLTDADLRGGGHIDAMYNFWPWLSELPMSEEDMHEMPERILCWMSTKHCHPLIENRVNQEHLGKELLLCANFEVPSELRFKMQELVRTLQGSSPNDWSDPVKVAQVLDLQEQCHALFQAGRAAPAPASGKDSRFGRPLLSWIGVPSLATEGLLRS